MSTLVQHRGYPPLKFETIESARKNSGLSKDAWNNLLVSDADDLGWVTTEDSEIQVKLDHPDFED